MRLIRLLMFCALPLMISGCLAVVHDETEEDKQNEHITDQHEQMIHELISAWEITHHVEQLQQAIEQEYVHWNNPQTVIPFVVTTPNLAGQEHIGLFQANNHWELKGISKAGHAFMLENNEGTVSLEHGSQKQTYAQPDFQFLLPLEHIAVIQEIIQEKNYEYLSWSQAENGWNVEFRSSIQPIEHVFTDYLQTHFTKNEKELNYQFHGFSILYTLQFRELEDKLVLKGIYFSLIKKEELVASLQILL